MKAGFEKTAPAKTLATMHGATADLAASGIMDLVSKVGDRAPTFTLNDSRGRSVSSAELLPKGPMVLTFYRGDW